MNFMRNRGFETPNPENKREEVSLPNLKTGDIFSFQENMTLFIKDINSLIIDKPKEKYPEKISIEPTDQFEFLSNKDPENHMHKCLLKKDGKLFFLDLNFLDPEIQVEIISHQ